MEKTRLTQRVSGVQDVLLVVILVIAVAVRLPMLPQIGYRWDMYTHAEWMQRVAASGNILAAYVDSKDFGDHIIDLPPLSIIVLMTAVLTYAAATPNVLDSSGEDLVDHSPELVTLLKMPGTVFDLLLVIAGYLIARRLAGWQWAAVIALALAVNPVLLADSAWWGQFDSVFTFFIVMTVDALNRRRPSQAWFFFALGILTKMQAIVVLPLLLAFTLRRSGWQALLRGVLVAGVTFVLFAAPFIVVSGPRESLRHYIEAVNKYPFVTVKGHNFWFWALASTHDMDAPWHLMPPDAEVNWGEGIYWGPVSARTVGTGMVGLIALLLMLRIWLRPERDDEFLLTAGLYAAFFTFATQMQARYLYPAVVLFTFAMIRRPALIPLWLGLSATVTYNIMDMARSGYPLWQTLKSLMTWKPYQNARINLVLTFTMLGISLAPLLTRLHRPTARQQRLAIGVGLVGLLVIGIGLRLGPEAL